MISEPEKVDAVSREVVGPEQSVPGVESCGKETVEEPVRTESHGPGRFSLSRSNQAVAMALAGIVIVLACLKWAWLSGWGLRPIEVGDLQPLSNEFRLNINEATATEWSQLDGIGEVLADRIVQDRLSRGMFESIDDLTRVEGIGPNTLEQIRPWLTVKQTD